MTSQHVVTILTLKAEQLDSLICLILINDSELFKGCVPVPRYDCLHQIQAGSFCNVSVGLNLFENVDSSLVL